MNMEKETVSIDAIKKICQQQYMEIEARKVQLFDIEEENRVLNLKIANLHELNEQYKNRINELEQWCRHLQSIIDKYELKLNKIKEKHSNIYRIVKRILGL